MSHPNEDTLTRAYAAFAQGDLAGYLSHCTAGITFRVPGRGVAAGTFTREQFVTPFISTVIQETAGSFRETVNAVVANDTHGLVLATHEFQRKGKTHRYNTAHIYRIDNGKLASFEEYPEDLYAFDQAWAR